jgi:predicted phage terminase large subunit-like protein
LVVNVPPGTGKSLLTGVLWPAWDGIAHPGRRWIAASYDVTLTRRDSARTLGLLRSSWYRARWPDAAEPVGDAASEWYTRQGGMRFATSVLGKATGRHADIQLVDDPSKPADIARSIDGAALGRVIDWWRGTMTSRVADPSTSARVIIMQRLHEMDLTGYVLDSEDGWTHVCLPMEHDPERTCRTQWGADPRTEPGALLAPERYPAEEVARMKADLGPMVWAAQYEQRPTPASGAVFEAGWLVEYDRLAVQPTDRAGVSLFASWDLAFKGSEGSDLVAGLVLAWQPPALWVVDIVLRRMTFVETCQTMLDVARRYPSASPILVEDKANGPALESLLRRDLPALTLVDPRGGKLARAHAAAPSMAAGHVRFPSDHPAWPALRDQLTRFPRGSHDDGVDALTQAINWAREKGSATAEWAAFDARKFRRTG